MSSQKQLYVILTSLCLGAYLYLAYQWLFPDLEEEKHTLCLIKTVTTVPCPSCGSTRSILAIVQGEFMKGLLLNPLGYFLLGGLLIIPFWLLADFILKKKSLYDFVEKATKIIVKKPYSFLFIALVILNWIWNINKGL